MIILGYILGLLIGLSLGLLGGGGSLLAVPVLHYVLQYEVREAVPMSLVVVGLTSAFGAIQHRKAGTVRLRAALAFGPTAIAGALLGAELGLRTTGRLQLTVFSVVMMAAAVSMWMGQARWEPVRIFHPAGVAAADGAEAARRHRPLPIIMVIGLLVGGLTGFVGVGGGFLYVPALLLLARLPMREAIGTSLVLIVLSCVSGFLRYQGSLRLDWTAIALFTAIAFVGVAAGARLVHQVPQLALRRGFAILLLVTGALVLSIGR